MGPYENVDVYEQKSVRKGGAYYELQIPSFR